MQAHGPAGSPLEDPGASSEQATYSAEAKPGEKGSHEPAILKPRSPLGVGHCLGVSLGQGLEVSEEGVGHGLHRRSCEGGEACCSHPCSCSAPGASSCASSGLVF